MAENTNLRNNVNSDNNSFSNIKRIGDFLKSNQSVLSVLKDRRNALESAKQELKSKRFEILKEIGIDLTTDKPYKSAFNFIKKQLEIYKSLCK